MADLTPDELNKLRKQLEEIEQLSAKFNRNINTANLHPIEENAGAIKAIWEKLNKDLEDSVSDTEDLVSNFQKLVGEVRKTSSGINESSKGLRGLSSISEKLVSHQRGYNELSSKDIKNLQEKAKLERDRLIRSVELIDDERTALNHKLVNTAALTPEYEKIWNQLIRLKDTQETINKLIENENTLISDLNNNLEKSYKLTKNLEDAMGLGGSAVEGINSALKKMGMNKLADKLGLDEARIKMKDIAEKVTEGGNKVSSFSDKFKILKGGIGSVGSSLITSLKDPLIIIGFLSKQFLDTLLSVDKQTGELAKNLNLSYKEASDLRGELVSTANSTGDLFVTTKGLQESLVAVGNSLGTNAKLNEKDLITFTKLREQAGLTNEELVAMEKLTLTTGGNLESNTKSLMAAAGSVAASNGVMLNQKTILQEISKSSKSLQLSLAGNPEALGRAAAQAKALGMSLEQVNSIADKMLDVESSISSELEAELLTGKELNLEQARLYALNNDIEGLSKEIAKNFGSAAEFSKMNRIQQEAAAKAVGMSREELAASLVEQQSLGKVSKEAFEARVKEVGLEKAQKELREGQFDKMMQQQSIQEKLLTTVEKLKEVLVGLVQPLMPLLDMLSGILGVVGSIVKFFTSIGETVGKLLGPLGKMGSVMKGIASIAVILAAYKAYASLATIPVIGAGLGIAAAAATLAVGMGALSKVKTANDLLSPGKNSPGYGDRTLFGPEGAIKLNNKDTLLAGTNLFDKGDDVISEPNKSIEKIDEGGIKMPKENQNPTSINNPSNVDITPLVNELKAVKDILGQILSKEGIVYLDSTKIGTTLNVGTSKIQ